VGHFKADRIPVEPRRDDDAAVAEVYPTVPGERRGAVSILWRYLVAIAVLAIAAVLSVTSLGSDHGRGGSTSAPKSTLPATARSTQAPPTAASTSPASCVDAVGYGGLGARIGVFDPNNNGSTGPAGPTPGTAWYEVNATARGCVTAFSVQDGSSPPLTGRDLLVLVSHPYLPRDAIQVENTDTCAVWKSAALRRATGSAYATATAVAQVGSTPGRAEIEATPNPRC
jgi:hypothetical protein